MNLRLVAKHLGAFCVAIGLLMGFSAAWAVYFREWRAFAAFIWAIAASVAVGFVLIRIGRNARNQFHEREGLGLVGLAWILVAGLGALPYLFAGVFRNPVDAYFESMSGFTTTGASVMTAEFYDVVPKSIMFWRAFTHWIGGMGIIVLFIAVLPYLRAGGKLLFKSESPGPNPRGFRPRIKDTAAILYQIYLGLTVVQTVALMLCGMNLYEALCHTFATLATGGFSTRAASVAAFDSVAVDMVILFFMICAGTNFVLFFAMLHGQWKTPFRDTEWRVYIALLAVGTLLVTVNLLGVEGGFSVGDEPLPAREKTGMGSFPEALRYASFQVVSIMTTTGFCTADFNAWPYFSRVLLLLLMFVGGCAGSTGGGMKVVRIVMLLKMAYWRLESTFRPHTVRLIRVSGVVIDDDIQKMVYGFFVIYLAWFAGGFLFLSFLGLPFETALTAVAATLNNIGPGLGAIGADYSYNLIPDVGKIFLSLCMVLGRLELFSICVLFIPSFWKHS